MFITTAQLHSTNPELRFSAGSNPARSVLEIRNGEDLWQFVPTGNKVKRLSSVNHTTKTIISARMFFKIKSVKNEIVPSNKTKKQERLVCNYLIVFFSCNNFFFLGLVFLFLLLCMICELGIHYCFVDVPSFLSKISAILKSLFETTNLVFNFNMESTSQTQIFTSMLT